MTTSPRTFVECLAAASTYLGDNPTADDLIVIAERIFDEDRKDAEGTPEPPALPPIGFRLRVVENHNSGVHRIGEEYVVTQHTSECECIEEHFGVAAAWVTDVDGTEVYSVDLFHLDPSKCEVVEPTPPTPAPTFVEVIDEDGDKLRVRSFESGVYAATISTERRSGDLSIVGLTRDDVRRVLAVLTPLA